MHLSRLQHRFCILAFAILFSSLGVAVLFFQNAYAHTNVFGPKTYTLTKGKPDKFKETLTLSNLKGTFILIIDNGNADGTGRVRSAKIKINNRKVVKEKDFKRKVGHIERIITLKATNKIEIELKGGKKAKKENDDSKEKKGKKDKDKDDDKDKDKEKKHKPRIPAFITLKIVRHFDDKIPPVIAVKQPVNQYSNQTPITVSGTVTDNLSGVRSVTVNGVAITLKDSTFSTSVALNAGSNTITITATDNEDNTSTITKKVTLDTTVPTISITSPADNAAVRPKPEIKLSYSDDLAGIDPGSLVFRVNDTVSAFSCTKTATSAICTPNTAFTSFLVAISVTVTDKAGNISLPATITVGLDTDGDGFTDDIDVFPNDPKEWSDIDNDGIGDNADPDRDNDGFPNDKDAFPSDPAEHADLDGDGIGDNGDTDRDGDGVDNDQDVFPDDAKRFKLPQVKITSPVTLTTVGNNTITVNGTVDDPNALLYVNGTKIAHSDGKFSTTVILKEGFNAIVARAVDQLGSEATSSVIITLDKTPPNITVQAPQNGATVNTAKINVTGLVNDIVRGTVNEVQASITVNGIKAAVANRTYQAQSVPLSLGENTLTIVATDQVGNTSQKTIKVTYTPLTGPHIQAVSGQDQRAVINGLLTAPLVIKLVNKNGNLVANQKVVFRVIQGDGKVGAGIAAEKPAVVATTNTQGQASARFILGSRAGLGNHRVRAKATGFNGEVVFNASADPAPGNKISINSGNNQRGAILSNLASPMIVTVTDKGGNVVKGTQVKFTVVAGGGTLQNDATTFTSATDTDGRASAQLTLGKTPGLDIHRVTASLVGTNAVAEFTASALIPGDPAQTKLSGLVLDNQDKPIIGVTVSVQGTTLKTQTDKEGQFSLTGVPVGPLRLIAEGQTTTRPGTWPTLAFDLVTVAGANNTMPMPIYLLPLDLTSAVTVSATEDTTLTLAAIPGFKLFIKAGSVTFPDGNKTGQISVTVVNGSKVPMAPPNGMQPQFIVTIQPAGAKFNPPARLTLPNVDGHRPGAEVEMYSFDHDLEEFVTIGLGTVSKDGRTIISNPGVGVLKAGWHCGSQPVGQGCVLNCQNCTLPDPGGACACVQDPNRPQIAVIDTNPFFKKDTKGFPITGKVIQTLTTVDNPCVECFNNSYIPNEDEDGITCGTSPEFEVPGWLRQSAKEKVKKLCKYCDNGECVFDHPVPPKPRNCEALKSSDSKKNVAYLKCLVNNVLRKFTGKDAPRGELPTKNGGNSGTHPGTSVFHKDCGGKGTEESCRKVSMSLHYCDLALDLRSINKCNDLSEKIREELKKLPQVKRVILESLGKPGSEHLHIEFSHSGTGCRFINGKSRLCGPGTGVNCP